MPGVGRLFNDDEMNLNILPLLISLSGAFLVFFIQQFLRVHLHPSGLPALFLGSAPNLIVGLWFPFSILIRPRAFTKSQAGRFFGLWCAGTFLLLVGFEIVRPFRGAQTFDYFDILASAMGVAIAFFIYRLWLENRLIFGDES
jgi:uncharacterized membrane protein YeaQ/YmgE (transglycosylase-associated protein family)